ncbi:hypothetical protein PC116_g2035 [Phytophthora cactorum]|nr:hypothetical protein PC116_g2035 [Phytophthora cactorum]
MYIFLYKRTITACGIGFTMKVDKAVFHSLFLKPAKKYFYRICGSVHSSRRLDTRSA